MATRCKSRLCDATTLRRRLTADGEAAGSDMIVHFESVPILLMTSISRSHLGERHQRA